MFPFFSSLSREILSRRFCRTANLGPLCSFLKWVNRIPFVLWPAFDRGNLCLYPTPIGCCLVLERLRFSLVFYDWAMTLQQHNATAPRLSASFRSAFFMEPGTWNLLGTGEIRQNKPRREGKLALSEGSRVLLV